jgi:hypothetical protein
MERDMLSMGLSEPWKEDLRLLAGLRMLLDCLETPTFPHARSIWRRVSCERTNHRQVRYEGGAYSPPLSDTPP